MRFWDRDKIITDKWLGLQPRRGRCENRTEQSLLGMEKLFFKMKLDVPVFFIVINLEISCRSNR